MHKDPDAAIVKHEYLEARREAREAQGDAAGGAEPPEPRHTTLGMTTDQATGRQRLATVGRPGWTDIIEMMIEHPTEAALSYANTLDGADGMAVVWANSGNGLRDMALQNQRLQTLIRIEREATVLTEKGKQDLRQDIVEVQRLLRHHPDTP